MSARKHYDEQARELAVDMLQTVVESWEDDESISHGVYMAGLAIMDSLKINDESPLPIASDLIIERRVR